MFDINNYKAKMEKALEHMHLELGKLRTGRANPAMLQGVQVEAYGNKVPIDQVALVSVPDARQLYIKPFDPNNIEEVEKGILEAELGFNPTNDGEGLRIVIPQPTEESRKDLVKEAKKVSEDCKVSIRNIRQDANNDIKKDQELTEDFKKEYENTVQDLVNEYNKKVDEVIKNKEQEIMSI